MMILILPYPPSINSYWRNFRGRMVKTKEAKQYHQHAALLARAAGLDPVQGDVSITMRVYRPRKSGDLDNRAKIVLDSLNGVAYDDDKQIVELHAYRFDDKENPRVEVEISST